MILKLNLAARSEEGVDDATVWKAVIRRPMTLETSTWISSSMKFC